MSFSHMLILGVIALLVIPPEKLPEFARQVARFIADLRRSTAGIWDDLKQDAAFKPEDILKPEDFLKPDPPRNSPQAAQPTIQPTVHSDAPAEVKSVDDKNETKS